MSRGIPTVRNATNLPRVLAGFGFEEFDGFDEVGSWPAAPDASGRITADTAVTVGRPSLLQVSLGFDGMLASYNLALIAVNEAVGGQREGRDAAASGTTTVIAVAEPDAWFAYPYWLDPKRAPDFDPCIAIFDKAGFDPCELFPPPGPFGKLHIARRVVQKMLRQAVPFDVINPDATLPRGARNIASTEDNGAVLITSWQRDNTAVQMESLKALLVERLVS